MTNNKKKFFKALTFMCVLALVASISGRFLLNLQASAAEISNLDLLNGTTLSGDSSIVADRESNTFISGRYGTAYIEMCDETGERVTFIPDIASEIEYDFDVKGEVFISPVEPDVYGYGVGNSFVDKVREQAGLEIYAERELPQGHYSGRIKLSEISWENGMRADKMMIRTLCESELKINKMQYIEPKITYEDIDNADLLALFKIAKEDTDKIDADTSDRVFTSHENGGTIMLYEYGYPKITPDEKAVLYYEFTIEPVDHNVDSENSYVHDNYHGKASVYPIYGNTSIQEEFLTKVSENNGVQIYDGNRLPAGEYKGTADLSSVWGNDTPTDTIVLTFGEYTKLTLKSMKFVNPVETYELTDIMSSYNVTGECGSVTVRNNNRELISGERNGPIILNKESPIKAEDGYKLYYDFSIEMTEHNSEDANHEYHGKASLNILVDGVAKDITDIISKTAGTNLFEGSLPANENGYKGVIDLSEFLADSTEINGFSARLNEFTKITLNKFRIVKNGDVNGDGQADADDSLDMRNYLLGKESNIIKEYADINGDSIVDICDMVMLAAL